MLLTINGLNVLNSYVGRDFMTCIELHKAHEFVRLALLYAGVFLGLTVVAVFYRFTEERLGLVWREWLTNRLVDVYLEGHVYYQLNTANAPADERIADDVRLFTASTLSLALIFLNGLFTILAFSGILWSISRLLFVVPVAYAPLGSFLAIAEASSPLTPFGFRDTPSPNLKTVTCSGRVHCLAKKKLLG